MNKNQFDFSMNLSFCLNICQNLKLASVINSVTIKRNNKEQILDNTWKSKMNVALRITNQDIEPLI